METTWRAEIAKEMARRGETFADVVHSTLSDAELDRTFDGDHGLRKGESFLLWTASRVYFAVLYDGAEWAGSVPRNPSSETPDHFGGE